MADIRPQPGPQEAFLSTPVDIAIYGGAAGGGKTYGLLLEGLRHVGNPGFRAVIFRRTTPQIANEGGIWDTSIPLYASLGAYPVESKHVHQFPSGARVKFSHLEYDLDCESYQGAQIAFIGFDELTHFTEHQFWYMLSRNRSMCGVRPYVRATTNPDPDSFVAALISWWIDQGTGYPIPERSGIVRWFVRENNTVIWADTKDELLLADPERKPGDIKSLTFISSQVYDNKILLEKDPGYLGNLKALSFVDRERLLKGNWKVRVCAGTMFRREWFGIVDAVPASRTIVRYWDRAATENADGRGNPDWTSGTKMSMDRKGIFYIEHLSRFQGTPLTVETGIANTASQDGKRCEIGIEQDPGQAGKAEAEYQVRNLRGYIVHAFPVHRDKVTRAKAYSAQVEAGNVKLVRGDWNEAFILEHENFPPTGKGKDDQVDSSSGAFMMLASKPRGQAASSWPGATPAQNNDWES